MSGDTDNLVTVYRRKIAASVERIWENVLDWEHIPHLHRSSFSSVELVDRLVDGWRGKVRLPTEKGSGESLLEIQLHRSEMRYTNRTLDGIGRGAEIVTKLHPVSAQCTEIEVAFFIPNLRREKVTYVAEIYTRLYDRLWDEDEAMMGRRQAVLDTRQAPKSTNGLILHLGNSAELRRRLPLAVDLGGCPFRIVEAQGELFAYPTQCPHLGGPLDASPVDDGVVTCPWHGYRFDVRSGKSCDGRRLRLSPTPAVRIDQGSGEVDLVWPAEV